MYVYFFGDLTWNDPLETDQDMNQHIATVTKIKNLATKHTNKNQMKNTYHWRTKTCFDTVCVVWAP